MCDHQTLYGQQLPQNGPASPPTARNAAKELARLIERQLGYIEGHVDHIALRLFLRAYWSKVATLAHAIHRDADE